MTWLWTINRGGGPTVLVQDWWPGARYVNWVGIDGYYFRKGDNFFEETVARSFGSGIRGWCGT